MMEWVCLIRDLAWRQREVPDEWKKKNSIPLHKMKRRRDECNSYRGINVRSVPGIVYAGALTKRLMKVTEGKVSEKEKSSVDQIFAIIIKVEERVGEGRMKNYMQPLWI